MEENDFKNTLDGIINSTGSDQEKIAALNDLIAQLDMINHNAELCLVTEKGAVLAKKANRPEMAAQFCLMRAKAEIAQAGMLIGEMKNLTTAISWFGFALETAENKYKRLEKQLNSIWSTTQALIDTGYKLLNEKPIVGAVAYCHNAAGHVYGSYCLQLKLYYFKGGSPWRARLANTIIIRWLGLDDFFLLNKEARIKVRQAKKDCFRSLWLANGFFKEIKSHEYVVRNYLDLSLEHHSFNSPIRSRYYLFLSRIFIRIYGLGNNEDLKKQVKSLSELPLIGSNRKEKITDILPEL